MKTIGIDSPALEGTAGSVITVGTFDGVHRGHMAVLHEVKQWAEHDGSRSILVTFDPHPLRIVRPETAPPLLTTPDEKERILAGSGIDYAVFVRFTRELSQYPPERFVDEILIERLHLGRLVIGYDHGFGRGRSGDVDTLREIGSRRNFEVNVVPPIQLGDDSVSSSLIRRRVQKGDVRGAAEALGRPYSLHGIVVRGDRRGRELGFPTANINVAHPEKLLPLEGIYAVRAVVRGKVHDGVLHLGPRPTFTGAPPTVELHIFEFSDDIYGLDVSVEFIARLRGIVRFESIDALVDAIRQDVEDAKVVLKNS